MKWIRWQGLGVFVVVLIIVSLFWLFFMDGMVRGMIEKAGTRAVGAKVELAAADLSLFPAGLKLQRLQVTNPSNPMMNMVEIAKVDLSFDTLKLLQRKVIIDQMTVDGVFLNSKRKKSGAIFQNAASTDAPSKKVLKAPKKGLCGEMTLPAFDLPDVKEILKREKLQSLLLAESLKTDLQAEKAKWQKELLVLPGKEQFDTYRARINKLKSKKGLSMGRIMGAGQGVASIQKEIQGDLDRIKKARTEFAKKTHAFKNRLDQVTKAPMTDFTRLKEKYRLTPKGLSNLGRLFVGHKLCGWSQKVLTGYEKLKPVLERARGKEKKGPEIVKPMRGRGVNVRFKEYAPLPDFLIRRAEAAVNLDAGALGGHLENITPDQHILGMPMTFEFSGDKMHDIQYLKIDGVLDHVVSARSKDILNIHLKGYEARDFPLYEKPELPISLKKAHVDLKASAMLKGNEITAKLSAVMKSVNLATGSKADMGPVAQAIVSALSNVQKINATADVTGTLEDYEVQVTSDLDRVLKNKLKETLKKQTASFEKQLKNGIFAEASGPKEQTKKSLEGFGGIGKELNSRMNMAGGLLGNLKRSF